MGTKMAVSFANIFMAAVETEIIERSSKNPMMSFSIELKQRENNRVHGATIKFTAEISDREITFLDTWVYKGERFKEESILDVRTHFKPTETFQYKHFTSCHPPGVRKGFIKGEAVF